MQDATERVNELKKLLEEYQRAYYIDGRPIVSDLEYDHLFDELVKLEAENPELKTSDSPTNRVGSDLSADFEEVAHTIPVLSLDKAYSDQAILSWIDKTIKNSNRDLSFAIEEKIDGFSIVLYYKDGILDRAVTRGNGAVGNDVTANVRTIYSVPLKLTESVNIAVRGEVYLGKKEFEKLNSQLDEPYANPRNLAAGTIRRNKSSETAKVPLSIFVYEGFWDEANQDHIEILAKLKKLGFTVNPHLGYFAKTAKEAQVRMEKAGLDAFTGSFEDIPSYIANKTGERKALSYEIDGLVVKVNEIPVRESLGYTEHHPRWAIAYKFEAPQAETKVNDIDVQVGRTGRVTPMARVQKVRLGGSEIQNITLHNQDYVNTLELAIGDMVSISKRGDVIPAVEAVVEKNTVGNTTWVMPTTCPICNSTLVKVGAHHFCPNRQCPERVKGSLAFFAGKDQMDIEALGPSTTDLLYEEEGITSISDLYSYDFNNLYGKPGFGEKKIENIKKGIANSKKAPFHRVLVSLGISEFGKKAVDLVLKAGFDSMDKLQAIAQENNEEALATIKNIGPKTAHLIIEGFQSQEIKDLIEELKKAGLSMQEEKVENTEEQIFAGQTWCVTGTFDNFNPRTKAMEEIKKRGGEEVTSVSSKTTCLLAGKNAGSKLAQAQKLGVRIVTEKEFKDLIEAEEKPQEQKEEKQGEFDFGN